MPDSTTGMATQAFKLRHGIIGRREDRDTVTIAQKRLDHGSPKVPDVPGGIHRHQNVHGIAFLKRVKRPIARRKKLNKDHTVSLSR